MKNILFIAALIASLCISSSALALTINPFDSGLNLAQSLLGSGVAISNVTYSGIAAASGYFGGGTAAGIGIDSGIVLTSGFASYLNGTANTSDSITGQTGTPGDANLDALVPAYATYDATVLEFDFQLTQGDAVYFNYVFGSEEYNEWVGSPFNDVFGFFFNGSNIAVIPGTSTPVAINNVNNGLNSASYNDNDPGDLGTPTPFAFEYDGFTDVFTASVSGLSLQTVYHIKLAVADAGDRALDSGVFLQAGSFSTTPVDPTAPVPEPATMVLLGTGLVGLAAARKKARK